MRTLKLILKGGLGNQLFQYFAAKNLADQQSRILELDISWYSREVHKNGLLDPRVYELEKYTFSKGITKTSKLSLFNSPYVERLTRFLPRSISIRSGFIEEMVETEVSTRERVITFGHWITQKYLPPTSALEKLLVDGLVSPSENFTRIDEELSSKKVTIIHLRLGDYQNFKEIYGEFNRRYFLNAFDKLGIISDSIWLFSDDIERANLLIGNSFRIDRMIGRDAGLSSAETLALMSKAGSLIASNSTFSWWAGYLNNGGQVVFPKQYMIGVETINTGLFVPNWLYL